MKNITGIIHALIFILLSNLFLTGHAAVIPVVPHGLTESEDFQVWVNGKEVFTAQAGNRHHGFYSFTTFDFTGSVTVRVKALRAIKWLDILPSSLDIDHRNIDNYTFEFKLQEPEMVTILLNNDKNDALHILTSRPETDIPDPGDENVLFYKGGETYNIGILDLKDDQTLYIEGGAVLKGMVRIKDTRNVTICGRGMIDGSDNKSGKNDPESDDPWRLIYMDHSENIKIEGITLFNSLRWTIHPYACKSIELNNIRVINWDYGSDGTDISACQNVSITNSFYRTNDDPIVIKALSFSDQMYYPNPRIRNMDVKNIRVEGCTVWNMPYGNVFEIGFELRCNKVSDIVFRDCDVLMQENRGAVFSIHNSDNAVVENVLFEDIRVENADQVSGHKLFDLAILYSMWSYDKFEDPEMIKKYRFNDAWDNLLPVLPGKEEFHARHRGHIRNIRFKNIAVVDGNFPFSVIQGYDKEHVVENVLFENITVQGKKINTLEELKLSSQFARNIEIR